MERKSIKSSDHIAGYGSSQIAKNEHNDCVVRAIASTFDMEYNDAHSFVQTRLGRKPKKGTRNTAVKLSSMLFRKEKINEQYIAEIPFKGNKNSVLTIFSDNQSTLDFKIIIER